ncbi:MAG: insulinase family protein, partial [Gemmatimonadetes bacterium]|nr:insulinase family protein [Gemmatimonadota bacterium]
MRTRRAPAHAFGCALAAALVAAAAPVAAQHTEPPPALPLEEVDFPPFEERTLSSGARLLVVSQHEVPFVTVTAVFRGGGLADPEGMEGLAGAAAELLTKGTATRSEAEIAEAVDAFGGSLGASSSDDWLSVSLSVLTPDLGAGLELMADVVMNPTFPADQLDSVRQQTLSALRASLGQPATLASRAFARAVYG